MTSLPRISAITLSLALLAATRSPSQAQDLPPANSAAILKELDQVASGAQHTMTSRRSAALSQIESAGASGPAAVEFTLRALEYAKYPDRHQDFLDWRKKNEDLLRSASYQNAALFQLRYLLLALKRSEQHDAYAQVPEVLAYLNDLSAQKSLQKVDLPDNSRPKDQSLDRPRQEALDLIQHPLPDSEPVKYLLIVDLLPTGTDFEGIPGNYQGIMEKNIRVPLLAKKDPRLLETWDSQIAKESAAATATGSTQLAETFNQNRIPELLFKKAQDTIALGQPNRALGEIMILIRNYPSNPSVKEWIDTARKLISPATTTVPPAGTNATAQPAGSPGTNR